jgi:hypothetical protein
MREMGNFWVEENVRDWKISAYNEFLSAEVSTRRFESAMEETSK